MEEFDVTAFLKTCVANAGMPKTKAAELKKYPVNKFLLKTTTQINEEFEEILLAARLDPDLQPDQVYISKWPDGTSTANLGSTLLSRRVTFSYKCDIRELSKEARAKGEFFCYESYFSEKYELSYRLVKMMEQEISEAYPARSVPVDELVSVLSLLEKEYKARYNLLLELSKKKYVTSEKQEIQKELRHLDVLISKLKRIHKGHY